MAVLDVSFSMFSLEIHVNSQVLITKHGELPDGTFYDPKTKKQFHYDHLRKVGGKCGKGAGRDVNVQ